MNAIHFPSQIDTLAGSSVSTKPTQESQAKAFGEILQRCIHDVNQLQIEADQSIDDLATGKQTDIHQTMIAVEKAGISFELLMQIRNKVIAAYETIMRTQV
jgi:flagellar hook-basal body complex protein FliE